VGFENKRNGKTMRPVAEDRNFLVTPTLLRLVFTVVIVLFVGVVIDDADDARIFLLVD